MKQLKWKIGKWASNKSFEWYKEHGKNYQGLPRHLEMLTNWYSGHPLRGRWVLRGK